MEKITINLDGVDKEVNYLETINVNGSYYAMLAADNENGSTIYAAKENKGENGKIYLTDITDDFDRIEIMDYVDKIYDQGLSFEEEN